MTRPTVALVVLALFTGAGRSACTPAEAGLIVPTIVDLIAGLASRECYDLDPADPAAAALCLDRCQRAQQRDGGSVGR